MPIKSYNPDCEDAPGVPHQFVEREWVDLRELCEGSGRRITHHICNGYHWTTTDRFN